MLQPKVDIDDQCDHTRMSALHMHIATRLNFGQTMPEFVIALYIVCIQSSPFCDWGYHLQPMVTDLIPCKIMLSTLLSWFLKKITSHKWVIISGFNGNKKYLLKRYLPIVPDPVLENMYSVWNLNYCDENGLAQERFHSATLYSFK